MRDADLKLLVVHERLISEVPPYLESSPVASMIVQGRGEEAFENPYVDRLNQRSGRN